MHIYTLQIHYTILQHLHLLTASTSFDSDLVGQSDLFPSVCMHVVVCIAVYVAVCVAVVLACLYTQLSKRGCLHSTHTRGKGREIDSTRERPGKRERDQARERETRRERETTRWMQSVTPVSICGNGVAKAPIRSSSTCPPYAFTGSTKTIQSLPRMSFLALAYREGPKGFSVIHLSP